MSEQLSFPFMDDKQDPNMGRVLTIRLKITDPQKAKDWLFRHENNPELGVFISASSNGDMFKSHDILEKALADLESKVGDSTGLIQETFDRLDNLLLEDLPCL